MKTLTATKGMINMKEIMRRRDEYLMGQWFKYASDKVASFSILSKLLLSFFIIVTPLYAFNFYVNDVGAFKNRKEISLSIPTIKY
jgi:hypothetical protein